MGNTIISTERLTSNKNIVFLKEQGNIKPEQLYSIIIFDNGKPDLLAIDLYSNIRSWYKPRRTTEEAGNDVYISKLKSKFYKTSYSYLSKQYHVSKETIRSKLVKLENLGLLNRAFTTEKRYYNREENNILNILIWKKTPHFESSIGIEKTKESLSICFKRIHIDELHPSPNGIGYIYSKTNNLSLKDIKKDILDKSFKSNFDKSNMEGGRNLTENNQASPLKAEKIPSRQTKHLNTSGFITKVKATFSGRKNKSISELAPISEDEALSLRLSSGREFNLSYINKLVEKLAKKYPDHRFFTRGSFLKYLSAVLANELRQEAMVNNEGFRFGHDDGESKINQYLNGIEDCKDTSKVAQLRRKIAATFEKQTAYKLLVSCYFNMTANKSKFEIKKRTDFEITETIQNKLLNEVRGVFGEQIEELIIVDASCKQESFEIGPKLPLNLGKENTIWNKVSKKLLEIFGEGIHASWFSRLEAQEWNQTITLKAPSSFIGNWVETNYLADIIKVTRLCGLEPYFIRVVA